MNDWIKGDNRLRGSASNIEDFAKHIIKRTNEMKIQLNEKSKILDIGCGDGEITNYLVKNYDSREIFACDISDFYFDKNIKQDIVFNLILNDGKIPFNENSFDFVYSFGVLQYIPKKDLKLFFSESRRVLKDGGFCCHFNFLDKSKIYKYYRNPMSSIKDFIAYCLFGGLRAQVTNKQWKDGSLWHSRKDLIGSISSISDKSFLSGFSEERSDVFFKK